MRTGKMVMLKDIRRSAGLGKDVFWKVNGGYTLDIDEALILNSNDVDRYMDNRTRTQTIILNINNN